MNRCVTLLLYYGDIVCPAQTRKWVSMRSNISNTRPLLLLVPIRNRAGSVPHWRICEHVLGHLGWSFIMRSLYCKAGPNVMVENSCDRIQVNQELGQASVGTDYFPPPTGSTGSNGPRRSASLTKEEACRPVLLLDLARASFSSVGRWGAWCE